MFGFNPWIILAVVLAFVGVYAAGYGKGHGDAAKDCAIAAAAADKVVAGLQLANKNQIIAAERGFNTVKEGLEKSDVEKQKKLDGLRIANGRLVDAAGGLFDRNGRAVRPAGVAEAGETAAVNPGAAPGCRLSDKLSDFLQSRFYDADRAAIYAQTCKATLTATLALCNGDVP